MSDAPPVALPIPSRAAPAGRADAGLPASGRSLAAYGGILAGGLLLSWLCRTHPAALPPIAPWDFSWPEYLATALTLLWFFRGLRQAVPSERLPAWRRACFLCGVGLIYAVLQTRFDYMAQHMFFLNRVQHVVMHHFGPVLIALGAAGPTLRRGMPGWLRRAIDSRPVRAAMDVLQQPVIAVLLFAGLFYLWLIPSVHFRAMIDPRLYAVMNWSMALDGILFWALILDARPRPPARLSFAARAAMAYATTFPEIIVGYVLASGVHRDLYPFYALCGRLYPSISALADQRIGGMIVWAPPAMMSAAATTFVLWAFLRHEAARTAALPVEKPR